MRRELIENVTGVQIINHTLCTLYTKTAHYVKELYTNPVSKQTVITDMSKITKDPKLMNTASRLDTVKKTVHSYI